MSRDNTRSVAAPEPPNAWVQMVARLIEPEAWGAFDVRARRKSWGAAEYRLELAERCRGDGRMASSTARAVTIVAKLRPDLADAALVSVPGIRFGQSGGQTAQLLGSLVPGDGEDELVLGVEDEAAPVASSGLFRLCPICLVANPCVKHALAVQIRAADDPELLQRLIDERAPVGRISDIEGHGA